MDFENEKNTRNLLRGGEKDGDIFLDRKLFLALATLQNFRGF